MNAGEGNICGRCSREYELPFRRHLVRPDDFDFLPAPRLLPCLHTICHSCLEELYQKERIICPQCEKWHENGAKGAKFYPLHYLMLVEQLHNDAVDVVRHCSRCYDDVPSFSWCQSCSSALCEFHHQDHRLSVDTSKHSILTFREMSHRGLEPEPRLPSITCPESPLNDCTLYCYTCSHLLSSQAMITSHKGHMIDDIDTAWESAREVLTHSLDLVQGKGQVPDAMIDTVSNQLDQLESQATTAISNIKKEFKILRDDLKKREQDLIEVTRKIAEEKLTLLAKQLDELETVREECKETIDITSRLLGSALDRTEGPEARPFVVASKDFLEARCKEMYTQISELQTLPHVDASISVSFMKSDIDAIKILSSSLGFIHSTGDEEFRRIYEGNDGASAAAAAAEVSGYVSGNRNGDRRERVGEDDSEIDAKATVTPSSSSRRLVAEEESDRSAGEKGSAKDNAIISNSGSKVAQVKGVVADSEKHLNQQADDKQVSSVQQLPTSINGTAMDAKVTPSKVISNSSSSSFRVASAKDEEVTTTVTTAGSAATAAADGTSLHGEDDAGAVVPAVTAAVPAVEASATADNKRLTANRHHHSPYVYSGSGISFSIRAGGSGGGSGGRNTEAGIGNNGNNNNDGRGRIGYERGVPVVPDADASVVRNHQTIVIEVRESIAGSGCEGGSSGSIAAATAGSRSSREAKQHEFKDLEKNANSDHHSDTPIHSNSKSIPTYSNSNNSNSNSNNSSYSNGSSSSEESWRGKLLGQVAFIIQVDEDAMSRSRLELRSFYESSAMDSIPVMRITKEFVRRR